ncbi:MAG: hypothetical protein A2X28_07740 [Elusimicrobia bacterium GWA2_56_46]|nr:MAG: hypothetical protein A2X28_07740 [Elusimicrobia bacterium GWA2_56_46]OGR53791.1 MAG: hypothetical protein A2X39_06690 [Elusimicrobia bacterium GWC2_56_31]HBB68026.1 hypothetical protein [Elusimicrobiota bacterium]HBW22643.1 hypothetical protein [Elusimicrobiota bacterium]
MKKILKFSAWGLALALAAALAAFLTLKFYFTPDRIKKLVLEYAERNLGREITLDAAALDLRGFSIKNLKVAEAGGLKKGTFLSAEDFSIRPDFKALLKKELQINSIHASGVALRIVQTKKDAYNFSDLLAGGAKSPAAEGNQAKPLAVSISDINIKNSSLIYTGADRSMTVTLSGLNLKAGNLTPEELFPFETAFTLGIRSAYLTGNFPVYVKGEAALGGWDPGKGRAEIAKASLKAGKISLELKGNLKNLLEPDAELSLRVKAFSTTDLKPYFPALPAHILLPALEAGTAFKLTAGDIVFKKLDFQAGPARGAVKGRLAWAPSFDYDLAADIKAQTPELDTTEAARKFRAIPKNIKIPLADLTARLTLSPKKVRLLAAGVSAKTLRLSASGEYAPSPAGAVSGRLKAEAGDLRDLGGMFPPLAGYDLKGSAAGELDFSSAKTLDLRGKLNFNGISAKAFDTRVSEIKGTLDFSKDTLKTEAAGKLEDSPLKISATVRNYQAHPQVELNADLAALKLKASPARQPAAAAAPAANPKKTPQAAGSFIFDLSGRIRLGSIDHPNFKAGETLINYGLKNISTELGKLSGSASFEAGGGKLDNISGLAAEYKTAKILLYPFLILGKVSKLAPALKLPDLNTLKFTRIEGAYTFQEGVMKIDKSLLRADAADADSSGAINLVKDTLDLKVTATPKTGISLPVPVGMTVKGPFANPSVKPDVASLLKQPVLKEKAEKLFKSLFKK